MHNYLEKIINNKKREVQALKEWVAAHPEALISKLQVDQAQCVSRCSLVKKLQNEGPTIIAEIKRRSPSKPKIAEIVDPVSLARQYIAGGAGAISVLTDAFGFNGSLNDLRDVTAMVATVAPETAVLRKDFIVDAVQLAQTRAYGADVVLLIAAVLEKNLATMIQTAQALGLDALVEVHTKAELNYALDAGAQLIGINNRDLTTFSVNVEHAINLLPSVPKGILTVAESGIKTPQMVRRIFSAGFDAVLIGEALVVAADPVVFLQESKRKV